MVGEILGVLAQMFSDLFGLFDEVFTKLDAWGLLLGAFLVFTIYRLLLVPVVGGIVRAGQSDVVRKSYGNVKNKFKGQQNSNSGGAENG